MADLSPTDREKRSWLDLAEAWLRMIVVPKVAPEDQTPEQKFDSEVQEKGTGQTRPKSSN
jgi:hypothetical protein